MVRLTNTKVIHTLFLALLFLPCCSDDPPSFTPADLLAVPSECPSECIDLDECTGFCMCVLCDHEWFEVEQEYAYLYIEYDIECIIGGPFVLRDPNGKEVWRLWVPSGGAEQGNAEIPLPEMGRYHFQGPLTFLGSRRFVFIYGI